MSAPSWMLGIVRATSQEEAALPEGWVRVAVPHDAPTSEVTGLCDGGLTAVGAIVQVRLDSTGRVVSISSPVQLPDGAQPVATGAMGRMLTEGLASAKGDLEKSREQLKKELAAAETRLAAADIPTDRIKPGAHLIGGALLADGAVTANKVVVNGDLWAKIANVAKITTDMLTAGDATIVGTAIVGDLIGNRLLGGELALYDSEKDKRKMVAAAAKWSPGDRLTTVTAEGQATFKVEHSRGGPILSAVYSETIGPPVESANAVTITASASTRRIYTWKLTVSYRTANDETGSISAAATNGRAVVTIPDHSEVFLITISGNAVNGANDPQLFVNAVEVTWSLAKDSGLRIWRDKTGQSRIDITTDGGMATMTSDGLTYTHGDTEIGRVSWATLVQPPAAIVTWPQNAGGNVAKFSDGALWVHLAEDVKTWGGCYVEGKYLIVPKAGWYQVDVGCGFLWKRGENGWAVAVGLWRRSLDGIGWLNGDPAMTLPLIPGTTTRPSASAIIHCAEGEGLALGFWQNTGSWKPNSGPSRMSVRMIQED